MAPVRGSAAAAACTATVSSVLPFPTAPKSFTLIPSRCPGDGLRRELVAVMSGLAIPDDWLLEIPCPKAAHAPTHNSVASKSVLTALPLLPLVDTPTAADMPSTSDVLEANHC